MEKLRIETDKSESALATPTWSLENKIINKSYLFILYRSKNLQEHHARFTRSHFGTKRKTARNGLSNTPQL